MTVETAVFTCSICGEPSRDICVSCTKDACANHRCVRCKRCSDCCECEIPLSATEAREGEQAAPHDAAITENAPTAPPSAVRAPEPVPEPATAEPASEAPALESQSSESPASESETRQAYNPPEHTGQ